MDFIKGKLYKFCFVGEALVSYALWKLPWDFTIDRNVDENVSTFIYDNDYFMFLETYDKNNIKILSKDGKIGFLATIREEFDLREDNILYLYSL